MIEPANALDAINSNNTGTRILRIRLRIVFGRPKESGSQADLWLARTLSEGNRGLVRCVTPHSIIHQARRA